MSRTNLILSVTLSAMVALTLFGPGCDHDRLDSDRNASESQVDPVPDPQPEPEPWNPAGQGDEEHPWFMYDDPPVDDLGDGYAHPDLTNQPLADRMNAIEAAGGEPAVGFQVYLPDGTLCGDGMDCRPVARVLLTERNLPSGIQIPAGDEGRLTAVAFRDTANVRHVVIPELNASSTVVPHATPIFPGPESQLGIELELLEAWGFPANMPPVNFPELDCSDPRTERLKEVWPLAHYYVWRGYQLIEFLGERNSDCRASMWDDDYDNTTKHWSPYNWFGPYAGYRFKAIRSVVKKLWERFREGKIAGTSIKIDCVQETQQLDPCFSNNPGTDTTPGAYHFPIGELNICPKKWADYADNDEGFARLLIHEMTHHTYVTWKEGILNQGDFVDDTHFHGGHDGALCINGSTEKMYGIGDSRHLAHTSGCNHRDKAFRNVDNYAYFFRYLGNAVYTGALHSFPTETYLCNNSGNQPSGGNECSEGGGQGSDLGDDYSDGLECVKVGGQWICTGGGGGGGAVMPSDCLAAELPPGG